jgi:uncharacterized protein YlxW (UPF0749 family)
MRSCRALAVGLLVAMAAALRPPPARRGISRRAAIFSAGSAATSCLLSHPAFADAGADREIAALTKKIAADEEDLIEDRKAKRELQLEIRQLRNFQKSEEAELKKEEKIERGLEKSSSQTGKVGKILGRVDQQVARDRSALSYEASELSFLEAKLKEDMEDERKQVATLKEERAQLAALGGAAPTRTDPQTVQGLKGQLTKEFKQSFALLVDKNAPRPSDALSDID